MKNYICAISAALLIAAYAVIATPQENPGTDSEKDAEVGIRIVKLMSQLQTQSDPPVDRNEIREQLVDCGPAATPFMIDLLSDKDPDNQSLAAAVLSQIGDKTACQPLRDLLFNYAKPEILGPRQTAMHALLKIDSKGTFDDLVKVIKNDPNRQNMKLDAVRLLCKYYPNKATVDICLDVLEDKNDTYDTDMVKGLVLCYMSTIKDERVPKIVLKATYSENEHLRISGAERLVICDKDAAGKRLLEMLNDNSNGVVCHVLLSLERLADPKTVDGIKAFLKKENYEPCRMLAFGVLLSFKDKDATAQLLKGLKSDLDETREMAAMGLRLATDPSVVPALIDVAQNDPTRMVRFYALDSLSELPPTNELYSFFLDLLREKDFNMNQSAIRFFSRTKTKRSIQILIDEMRGFDATGKTSALKALEESGDMSAIWAMMAEVRNSKIDSDSIYYTTYEKILTRLACQAMFPLGAWE